MLATIDQPTKAWHVPYFLIGAGRSDRSADTVRVGRKTRIHESERGNSKRPVPMPINTKKIRDRAMLPMVRTAIGSY